MGWPNAEPSAGEVIREDCIKTLNAALSGMKALKLAQEFRGKGNKKHKWLVQNRQGEVKNSIGNGEAKELICTTHGHELRCRGMLE